MVADYSSLGPNITDSGIKPELVAPGNLFTAAQNYDPNGALYSVNRWVGAEGTNFPAALAAGAVALVKQAHPTYNAAQLKSAGTNTAVTGLQQMLPPATMTLSPRQAALLTVTLTGTPAAGFYEGVINVSGGATPLRIPYLYMVSDLTPTYSIPLTGSDFVIETGNGVPIAFAPGASVGGADSATDGLGIAGALMKAPVTGTSDPLSFFGRYSNSVVSEFDGRVRSIPQIAATSGVVDAVSGTVPSGGFVPGSYISIFGSNLSENTMLFNALGTSYLPLSLAGVSVSFDSTSTGVHAAGHLSYVSPTQINVQVPWELAGSSSAAIKVTLSNSSDYFARTDDSNLGTNQSQVVTIPIGQYAPTFYFYSDPASGQKIALATTAGGALVSSANPILRGQPLISTPTAWAWWRRGHSLRRAIRLPVAIGAQSAQVLFSGLAPNYVGSIRSMSLSRKELAPGCSR